MKFQSRYSKTVADKFWLAFGGGSKRAEKKEIDGSLHYAALTNKLWRADYLIRERNADVATSDHFCIRWAARHGYVEMMSLLLDHGADVNAKDGEPLINAIEKGHDMAATFLLDHGADASLHKGKALVLAHEKENLLMLGRMLASKAPLENSVRELLEKARTDERENLVRLYERHLGIAPPIPPKMPKPPKLK